MVGQREEINLKLKVKDISDMISEIFSQHYDPSEASLAMDPLRYIGDNCLKVSAVKGTGMKELEETLRSLAVDRSWYVLRRFALE